MERIVFAAAVAAVIGTGLIAGTFFVFSVAIMPAFRQLPAASAMAAMKRINDVIQNALFLGVFTGTAIVSVGLAVWSVLNWGRPATAALLTGAALYVIGSFGLTIVFNVPLNNALAGSDDVSAWTNYEPRWTFGNHVRTIASILATGSFTVAAAEIF